MIYNSNLLAVGDDFDLLWMGSREPCRIEYVVQRIKKQTKRSNYNYRQFLHHSITLLLSFVYFLTEFDGRVLIAADTIRSQRS